jgi:hypothetical protein
MKKEIDGSIMLRLVLGKYPSHRIKKDKHYASINVLTSTKYTQ